MASRGPDPVDKSEQIRRALLDNDRPFMGTGELADKLGYESNPGVNKHLQRAEEKNDLKKTTISGYNVWYLPELSDFSPNDDEEQTDEHTARGRSGPGGGYERKDGPNEEYGSLFRRFFSRDNARTADLPGVLLALVVAYAITLALKAGLQRSAGVESLKQDGTYINGRALLVAAGGLTLYAGSIWTFIAVGWLEGLGAFLGNYMVVLGAMYLLVFAIPHAVISLRASGLVVGSVATAGRRIKA